MTNKEILEAMAAYKGSALESNIRQFAALGLKMKAALEMALLFQSVEWGNAENHRWRQLLLATGCKNRRGSTIEVLCDTIRSVLGEE